MAPLLEGSALGTFDLAMPEPSTDITVDTQKTLGPAASAANWGAPCAKRGSPAVKGEEHGGRSRPCKGDGRLDAELADLEQGLMSMRKCIPCRYLYNEQGNDLYAKIIKLKEYDLFRTELGMLEKHANEIAAHIPCGAVCVELGCGSAAKTSIILQALLRRYGAHDVRFTGIDILPQNILDGAALSLAKACQGLLPANISMISADYSTGVKRARQMHPGIPLCFIWLGSSIGNLDPKEAPAFLQNLLREGGPGTQLFLCADLWKSSEVLHAAYCDAEGVTEEFIQNGLLHALSCLPTPYALDPGDWTYKVVVNPDLHQVEMYLQAQRRINNLLPGVHVDNGESILMEVSRKFTTDSLRSLAFRSGFHVQAQWCSKGYSMQMLLEPMEAMSLCHAATDELFAGIDDWDEKPIDLRHHFGFYIGHLAAFAAVKALREPGHDTRAEEDRKWDDMFVRGIDPSVLDPSQCHSHPEIPEAWPKPEDVRAYVEKARGAILHAISRSACKPRTTHLLIEHDLMHHETLAYMLAQRQRARFYAAKSGNSTVQPDSATGSSSISVLPPTSAAVPSGESKSLPNGSQGPQVPCARNEGTSVPPSRCEPLAAPVRCPDGRHFSSWGRMVASSWDSVSDSTSQHRSPSGNALLEDSGMRSGHLNEASGGASVGAATEFVAVAGGEVVVGVDTDPAASFVWDLEGPPQGPVTVSSFQAASAPVSIGEFYHFAVNEGGYERPELWEPCDFDFFRSRGQTLPATWSSQDGDVVVHSPGKSRPLCEVMDWPVWVSLAEARAFCRSREARVMTEPEYLRLLDFDPDCEKVTQMRTGGWEWTDTLLEPFKGFEPMPEYPEYSTDFYDGQHYVLRGSSPFTPPPLRRDSFRNFFQRQYPYVFAKFRCCR